MSFDFDEAFNNRPLDARSSDGFPTDDGERIAVTGHVHGHSAAVLVVPGMLMTRDCPEHRLFAHQLRSVADVFTIDVRGHGDSTGNFSFGVREPRDVVSIATSLRLRYDAVGGVGFSLGGHHVLVAASTSGVFDAVVAAGTPIRLLPFDRRLLTRNLLKTIPMVFRRRHGWNRLALPSLMQRRPSLLQVIGGGVHPPMLIAHGLTDWLVPASHARSIFDRLESSKELLLVRGAGHAESLITEPSGVFSRSVEQFMRLHLARRPLNAAS